MIVKNEEEHLPRCLMSVQDLVDEIIIADTGSHDRTKEIAASFRAKIGMGLRGGMLVTNPIPEEYSMDPEVINKAIDEAVAEANALGIHGKQTTPFLLAKIKDITGGDSLASNIRLVYNNAQLAAKIACKL